MEALRHSDSVVVARPPGDLYALVADVTRMGEWSPICTRCWWDDGDGPRVGAWFTGRNEHAGRTWETRCEVVAAGTGREFAWVVEANGARWGYTFTPVDDATLVTESWELPPAAVARFGERFGADAEAQMADRLRLAQSGIPATLAAIKVTAETR